MSPPAQRRVIKKRVTNSFLDLVNQISGEKEMGDVGFLVDHFQWRLWIQTGILHGCHQRLLTSPLCVPSIDRRIAFPCLHLWFIHAIAMPLPKILLNNEAVSHDREKSKDYFQNWD